ncbi:MAG: metallophosphoesterase family protein, partial [Candidatus Kariarchaeaceae archaeon]
MSKLSNLVNETSDTLRDKPLLRLFRGDAIVAGDIHGDLDALEKVIDYREQHDIQNLILLGDYVDRGPNQIEVVKRICELILSDNHFIALRGNHEDVKVCSRYGFVQQLEKANEALDPFPDFFRFLPLAVKNKKIFMVHGGVPINQEFKIADINSLPRKERITNEDILLQLLWNDPIFTNDRSLKNRDSFRGYDCYEWDIPTSEFFLKKHQFDKIIRAH